MIEKIDKIQKLEETKELYLKDSKKFKDFLNSRPGSCFQKIGTIDFVDDNENFKLIRDLCDKNELNENVDIFEHIIHSAVEGNDGLYNVTISNSIAFVLHDGSLLRFLPSKGEGLVISRVLVTEINRSKGNGTALMNMFLIVILLSIKSFPDIELECTGNINSGTESIKNPISSQIRFFRKFGFRVVREESEYPAYVKMKFDFSKFVETENMIIKKKLIQIS